MKQKIRNFLSKGSFGIILILLICLANSFFQPTWLQLNNFYTTRSFYEEPKNRIETLFLGASVGAYGFSPMDLYREYGISAFNVSTQSQPVIASYYWLREAYRLHPETLKNVIFDVSELRKNPSDSTIHKAFDGMKLSPVKLEAVLDYTEKDFTKALSYILPLTTYHSRWDEIEEVDFEKYSFEKVNSTRGFEFTLMTYFSTKSSPDEMSVFSPILNSAAEPAAFKEAPLEYFNKINEFCKEKGITLTLVKTPTNNWSSANHNAAEKLAEELGLTFIDFNFSPVTEEISYVHAYDSREGQHVNYYGAKKLMTYLGRYLTENCTVTDVRGNGDYLYLEKQYEKFDSLYYRQFELSMVTDVTDALGTALKDDNTVFITVMDEASTKLTAAQREFFRSLGLTKLSEIDFRDSYIGIINKDGVICETLVKEESITDESPVTYEGSLGGKIKYTLKSGSHEAGNISSCVIDGEEYSKNKRGINITVFSNTYEKEVYSLSFDTYTSDKRDAYNPEFNQLIYDKEAQEKYKDNKIFNRVRDYQARVDKKKASATDDFITENNDIFSYLNKYLKDESNVIFISVKDEASTCLSEKDRRLFGEFGLSALAELQFRECMMAVIENGEVIYQAKCGEKDEPIAYESGSYQLKNAGFSAGNISSIKIDGTEYSPDRRGINVVIYNKADGKVSDSTFFDTYTEKIYTPVR